MENRDDTSRYRILMVAGNFPPYNSIGAIRLGKMGKYLTRSGHEVKVLTVREPPLPATAELEVLPETVHYTKWINVNRPVEMLLGGRQRVAAAGYSTGTRRGSVAGKLVRTLGSVYKAVANVPDGYIGWYVFATREGERIIREWRPDIIYASAHPVTSHLVANSLARKYSLPWIAEYRDLWVDSHYYRHRGLRRKIDSWLERRTLSSATGLVTVSEVWASTLAESHNKPVAVIHNGFDPSDYPDVRPSKNNQLRLTHTGMIYEGKRDPTPLFRALASLGPLSERVKVSFVGRYLSGVMSLAQEYGVQSCVEVLEPVPHKDSIRLQCTSDVLLLLLWDDPGEKGTYTGKLYEYLGTRRPLLVIGPEDSLASRLVRSLDAGVVETDPSRIAVHLRNWISELDQYGQIQPNNQVHLDGFTRESQAEKLSAFITQLLSK